MPSTYLLRIEGVNLDQVLDDTSQLSVRRGGSLLLRQAVLDLKGACPADTGSQRGNEAAGPSEMEDTDFTELKALFQKTQTKPISTGASVGLFHFQCSEGEAESVRDVVAIYLASHCLYRFLTFVADIAPLGDGFALAREAVIAKNRFRQLQQLSLALPPRNTKPASQACGLDGVRPADGGKTRVKGKEMDVSKSVLMRLHYGQDKKQTFFAAELESLKEECPTNYQRIQDLDYATDFDDIAGKSIDQGATEEDLASAQVGRRGQPYARSDDIRSLNDKLAVIYFDGNRFSAIQQSCRSTDSLRAFDRCVQESRRHFLKQLLDRAAADSDFRINKIDKDELPRELVRLELLLWGGDEMMLAVPAWKGIEVLQLFYECSKNLVFEYPDEEINEPLTHAGALVFCHKKTPIRRMRLLAQQLAEDVKSRCKSENRYEYMVLESIDYPAEPLQDFAHKRYGVWADARRPLPRAAEWQRARTELETLVAHGDVPRGRIYEAVRRLVSGAEEPARWLDRFYSELKDIRSLDKSIPPAVGCAVRTTVRAALQDYLIRLFPEQDDFWRWIHLVELWDYLLPVKREASDSS